MLKSLLNKFFKYFNIKILKHSNLLELQSRANSLTNYKVKLKFLDFFFSKKIFNKIFSLIMHNDCKSELMQDIYVLSKSKFKKKGVFIEIGACDGILSSNTYLLEKVFKWKGVLVEPAFYWHKRLKLNRKCSIETSCAYSVSNEMINFNETYPKSLSSISNFSFFDQHSIQRKLTAKKYKVKTISLNDLFDKYQFKKIDFLSIDTEGSEYEILKKFNFYKYQIKIICCEHNYTVNRNKIFKLLNSKGYKREYENLSQYDDWYFKKSLN
jgi:FkbM family methyltransferase